MKVWEVKEEKVMKKEGGGSVWVNESVIVRQWRR